MWLGKTTQNAVCQVSSALTGQANAGCGLFVDGYNLYGELKGDGNTAAGAVPTKTIGLPVGPVVSVADGTFFAVAASHDGMVWAWGRGDLGEMENSGTTLNNPTPQMVPGLSSVIQVAASSTTAYALKADGIRPGHGARTTMVSSERGSPPEVKATAPSRCVTQVKRLPAPGTISPASTHCRRP